MGLFDQANEDIKQITNNGDDWAIPIKLISAKQYFNYNLNFFFNTPEVSIMGIHTDRHMNLDTLENKVVNTKIAHVSFSEQALLDLSFPIRNADGEVDLKGYMMEVTNDNGDVILYRIEQWYPDESVGLIACSLKAVA